MWPVLLLLAASLIAPPETAKAEEVVAGAVLTPASAQPIDALLRNLEESMGPSDAAIRVDHVFITTCARSARNADAGPQARSKSGQLEVEALANSGCFKVRLQYPTPNCPGELAPPWCLVFEEPAPNTASRLLFLDAVKSVEMGSVWQERSSQVAAVSPAASPVQLPQRDDSVGFFNSRLGLGLIGFSIGAFALLIGLVAGFLAAKRCQRRKMGVAGRIGLATALLLVAAGSIVTLLPFWDWLMALAFFGAGVARTWYGSGRNLWPRHDLGVALVLILSAGALEVGSRLLLPPPPILFHLNHPELGSPGEEPGDAMAYSHDEMACRALQDTSTLGPLEARIPALDSSKEVVLHLGDSMLYWLGGLAPEETVVGVLASLDNNALHVNGSVPATGPDLQFALLDKWLDRVKPIMVVYHLCLNNDAWDLSRGWSCCAGYPLLRRTQTGPHIRDCGRFDPASQNRERYLDVHTPPYLIRATATCSTFARHVFALMQQGTMAAAPHEAADTYSGSAEDLVEVMLQMHRRVTERGIPFIVILAPFRDALENKADRVGLGWKTLARISDIPAEAGLHVLNASDALSSATGHHPLNSLFLDDTDEDFHLSRLGHRIEALWLYDRLFAHRQPQAGPSAVTTRESRWSEVIKRTESSE